MRPAGRQPSGPELIFRLLQRTRSPKPLEVLTASAASKVLSEDQDKLTAGTPVDRN